jgi:hypothetical protein
VTRRAFSQKDRSIRKVEDCEWSLAIVGGLVALMFRRQEDGSPGPLWTYLADPASDPATALNQLRAEVWR